MVRYAAGPTYAWDANDEGVPRMRRSMSAGAMGSYISTDLSFCGSVTRPLDYEEPQFYPWKVMKDFEGRKLISALTTGLGSSQARGRAHRVGGAYIDHGLRPSSAPDKAPPPLRRNPLRHQPSDKHPRIGAATGSGRPRTAPDSMRGAFPWGRGAWKPNGPVGLGIPTAMTISRERQVTPPIGTPGIEKQEEDRPATYLHGYCPDNHAKSNWGGAMPLKEKCAEEGGPAASVGSVFDLLAPAVVDDPEFHEGYWQHNHFTFAAGTC